MPFANMRAGLAAMIIATGLAAPALAADTSILVQSTTSTENTGLYKYLLPIIEKATGVKVNVVAVGTGQAIKNAQNCDGDVLLVHARSAEEKFVAEGYGVSRAEVMYNDFIIVGPAADPAKINGTKSAEEALKKIAAAGAPFASRGDDSGTHKAELALWKAVGVDVKAASGSWYRETGSGMGATLNTAVGMGAYVLTDRGSWISFKNRGDFKISVEGDPKLFNQYGVILVNKDKCPNVKAEAGQKVIDWILSAEGQNAIRSFKIEGEQLFFPNAEQTALKKAG